MITSVHSFFDRVSFSQRLKQAVLLFYIPLMLTAIIPVIITALSFGDIGARAPNFGAEPVPTLEVSPSSDLVSDAWDAAVASNDIVVLRKFVRRFPNSQNARKAKLKIAELEKNEDMQLANSGDNIALVAQLLKDQNENPDSLNEFIRTHGLKEKYPLGFGLFYSNTERTLYYTKMQSSAVKFDLSAIRVLRMTKSSFCFSGFSAEINTNTVKIGEACFAAPVGSTVPIVGGWPGVSIIAESLGVSAEGAAWVIGIVR